MLLLELLLAPLLPARRPWPTLAIELQLFGIVDLDVLGTGCSQKTGHGARERDLDLS